MSEPTDPPAVADARAEPPPAQPPAAVIGTPSPSSAPPAHSHPQVEAAAGSVAGGRGLGPFRLFGFALLLFLVGLGLRWCEDVAAPWLNLGEAELADTISIESPDGGRYRLLTSGPTRPVLELTVCRVTDADGEVQQTRGSASGGQTRLGVSRITTFEIPPGAAEFQCGNLRPEGGAGQGRFQVVAADGVVATVVTGLVAAGVAGLLGAIAWFGLRTLLQRRDR